MILNTQLQRDHSYLWVIPMENSVSQQENYKYFSHKIKFHYQKLLSDTNLCALMIARIAQHSFNKIQNCLEDTISKMCANRTDRSRVTPSTPSAASSASFPGKTCPLLPRALHTSSVRCRSCRPSLPGVAFCADGCRGESMS